MTGYDVYRKALVDESSPRQNIVLLLNKIITNCNNGNNIKNSLDILCLLDESLDFSVDADFCDKLSALYMFCIKRLLLYNINNDSQNLEDVKNTIIPIKEGFANK